MELLDRIGELEILIEANMELVQQLVDDPDMDVKKFNVIDAARVAVQDKIKAMLEQLEVFAKYGAKGGIA